MNIPPSLIILSLVVLFLTLFFVVGINESLPAFVKTEYDSICNRYFSNIIINGGLTSTDITNLKNELTQLGLSNININIFMDGDINTPAPPDRKIEWGRRATLLVTADYEYESVSFNGGKKSSKHTLKYENSSTVLSLDND